MSFIGMKYYNVPIVKTLWPLFTGAGITFYLIGNVANAMSQAPEYVNDPRNPNAGKKH